MKKSHPAEKESPKEIKNLSASLPLPLSIGKIRYLNMLPFFHGLTGTLGVLCRTCQNSHRPLEFKYFEHSPAHLNRALHHSKIDVAPISSLAYLLNQDQWILLPDLAIGSRDFSGSVILFSKEPIEGLNKASIAVTSESLSSISLLKILFRFKYKFTNRFVAMKSDPDHMLEQYKAALVIGDDALFYKPKDFVYKYDLSELWWNWTGKPFCFSVWAVRKEIVHRFPDEVRCFARRVKDQREVNLVNIETLLKESLGLGFMDPKFSKLFGYLFNLSFGMDETMIEGLELFYRLAYRYGLAPRAKPLEFLSI